MAEGKVKHPPKIKTKRSMKPLMLLTMIMLLLPASACRGSHRAQTGTVVSAYSPTPTGEYTEFSCHSNCPGHRLPRYETRIHDADYIEKYADTLNAMFDYEWTLLSVEEIYEAFDLERFIYEFMCHLEHSYRLSYAVRSIQFYEWTIEYRDGNGDVRHFVFDNRSRYRGFSRHVQLYVRNYITEYYRERFFDVYMRDIPLAPQTFFFVFFARAGESTNYERWREWTNKTEEYQRLLSTPEGAIRLAQLTPANIFEMAPVEFSIRVALGEYAGSEQQAFQEYVMTRIEDMIETLNHFTNNQLRISISMSSYRWHYLQGERIFVDHPLDFDWYVLESYRGVFW